MGTTISRAAAAFALSLSLLHGSVAAEPNYSPNVSKTMPVTHAQPRQYSGTKHYLSVDNWLNSDEKSILSFAQNQTSIDYTITAVPEKDDGKGFQAVAYLVNGVTDKGYWYQIGISWHWTQRASFDEDPYYMNGFFVSYEVMQNNYGTYGHKLKRVEDGIEPFPKWVSEGDKIEIKLSMERISLKHDEVVMLARDINTGASITRKYDSLGATCFNGTPNSNVEAFGKSSAFTGLMTERLRTTKYLGEQAEQKYIPVKPVSTPAWLSYQSESPFGPIDSRNTQKPVTPSSSTKVKYKLDDTSNEPVLEYLNGGIFITYSKAIPGTKN